jgi:hypothetical protein
MKLANWRDLRQAAKWIDPADENLMQIWPLRWALSFGQGRPLSAKRRLSTWNSHETLLAPLDTSMKESTIRVRPDEESWPGRLADFKWPSLRI